MEQELDMHTIYIKTGDSTYAPYEGGPTFLNGTRKCNACGGKMVRDPLGNMFVRTAGGKILVTTTQSGRLVVSKADTDYHWVCESCVNVISSNMPL